MFKKTEQKATAKRIKLIEIQYTSHIQQNRNSEEIEF